ncbi:hypothetical protein [Candidatus Similichlamydia laticola]|uniref:Protease III n=1 Tax=Candidatus Similichlamydia laticola TaxID=2170265 RepID=A0A369KEE4_9BACT|nr:hypothetical protein [Candidatus Similichlamydia laticola]RDB31277.1 hypothetical protein HAT2_00615 [Candidatus Similichlamydia laticola]
MQGFVLFALLATCLASFIPKFSQRTKVSYTEIVDGDPTFVLENQTKYLRKKILLKNGSYALILREKNLPYSVLSFCFGWGFCHDPPDQIGLSDLFIALLQEKVQPDLVYDCLSSFHVEKMSHRTSVTLSIFEKNLEGLCEHLSDLILGSKFSLDEFHRAKERAILDYSRSPRHQQVIPSSGASTRLKEVKDHLERVKIEDLLKWIHFYFSTKEFRLILVSSAKMEKSCFLLSRFFSGQLSGDHEGFFIKKTMVPSSGKLSILPQQHHLSKMTMIWKRPQPYHVNLPCRQRSEDLVRELFSSKSEGSLFQLFQTRGWIYQLDSLFTVQENMGQLHVTVGLTEKGMPHWKEIVEAFQALPRYWIHSSNLATHHQKRHETRFTFERFFVPHDWKQIVRNWSKELLFGEFALFPYYNTVPCFFDQKSFWNCLLEMCSHPADVFLYLHADDVQKIIQAETTPYGYNTWIKTRLLGSGKTRALPSALHSYKLPDLKRNFFTKKDMQTLKHKTKKTKQQPSLWTIKPNSGAPLLILHDFLPMKEHAYWSILFHPPMQAKHDLRQRLKWKLLQWILQLHLEPFRAEAETTQNNLNFREEQLAWSLDGLGWAECLHELFTEALKQIFAKELEPTFFEEAKKVLSARLISSPFLRLDIAMGLDDSNMYQIKEQLRVLESISFGELISLFRYWVQSVPVEAFFIGPKSENLSTIWDEWSDHFSFIPHLKQDSSTQPYSFRLVTEHNSYLVSYDIGPDVIEYQPYQALLYRLFLDTVQENHVKDLLLDSRCMPYNGRVYIQLSVTDLGEEMPSALSILQVFERCLQKLQRMESPAVFYEIQPTLVALYRDRHRSIPELLQHVLRENLPIYSQSNKKKGLATIADVMSPRSFQDYLEEVAPYSWGGAFKTSLETFACYDTKTKNFSHAGHKFLFG